jgi:hypothetical protein
LVGRGRAVEKATEDRKKLAKRLKKKERKISLTMKASRRASVPTWGI